MPSPPEPVSSPAAPAVPPARAPALPLEEALLALDGAAAALAVAPPLRLLVARHGDFWRFQPGALPDLCPWDAVFPLAALTPNGLHLLAILLEAAARAPGLAAVAGHAVSARRPAPRPVGEVFVGAAREFERVLPVAALRGEPARREALLRAFARRCDAPVAVGGVVESPEQSARTAQRLDVAALIAQEKAMRRQMRLMEAARAANVVIASGSDLGP